MVRNEVKGAGIPDTRENCWKFLLNVFINFAKPGYKAKAKEVTVVTQFGIVVTYYEFDTFAL